MRRNRAIKSIICFSVTLAFLISAGFSDIISIIPPGDFMDTLVQAGTKIETTLVEFLLCPVHKDKPGARNLDTLTTSLAAFGVKQ